ncbi:nucleoside deaminase [Enterococcus sp. DIV1298c]|uniref:nucleoside deaminase n=1 Tax=Enterococcus sp. DIV1298c TaxID=2815328 RepID=UPI001F5CF383|nr:nucleoside deaminase [Enterococcus sp. DIV1298c]
MNYHPQESIMSKLIQLQKQEHSIIAAVIDNKNMIVSIGKTTVFIDNDPTSHAEVNAVRQACKQLNTHRLPQGYWLYSTFEPCPLCSSAIIWAGIDGVVYSNNPAYRGKEQNWSFISCEEVLQKGSYIHDVSLIKDFMIDEIKDYFT